jgi:DNA topoisomerase I
LTPADLDPEQVEVLLKQKTEGPDKLGLHPETGEPIYSLIGSYGPYVQLGDATEENPKPKRASLPKGKGLEDVTLEMAVGLLALPRLLGVHPETGNKIQASLGRFGPYVVHKKGGEEGKDDYRSLKAGDDVLMVTLERALELFAEPKKGGKRRSTKTPLRELGTHPDDGEPINIYEGPYGNYVKYQKTNVGIPEGETVEGLTLEKALELLAAKVPKSKSKSSGSKTTSGKTQKKTTTKTTRQKKTSS